MKSSIESTIRRLIARHALDRIEIVSRDGKRFTAIAYPAAWSPVVAARRQAGFDTLGKTEVTFQEAREISDRAAALALARATAGTIYDALAALALPG
jgi:hypothetical protein